MLFCVRGGLKAPPKKFLFSLVKKKMKSPVRVFTEAVVVGAVLALMMFAGLRIAPRGTGFTILVAFLCGFAFHIGCQVTGINDWYARTHFD